MNKSERHKYAVLSEAYRKNHIIRFDVLYYAKSSNKTDIIEEIGEAEGYYIRKCKPPLNYQIPHEDDWHKFDTNPTARSITLD